MRGNSCCQDQDDPIAPFLFPFLHNRFWIRAKPSKGLLLSNNLAMGTIPNEGKAKVLPSGSCPKKLRLSAGKQGPVLTSAGWQDGRTKDET